jgi:hypothetical protein
MHEYRGAYTRDFINIDMRLFDMESAVIVLSKHHSMKMYGTTLQAVDSGRWVSFHTPAALVPGTPSPLNWDAKWGSRCTVAFLARRNISHVLIIERRFYSIRPATLLTELESKTITLMYVHPAA